MTDRSNPENSERSEGRKVLFGWLGFLALVVAVVTLTLIYGGVEEPANQAAAPAATTQQ